LPDESDFIAGVLYLIFGLVGVILPRRGFNVKTYLYPMLSTEPPMLMVVMLLAGRIVVSTRESGFAGWAGFGVSGNVITALPGGVTCVKFRIIIYPVFK